MKSNNPIRLSRKEKSICLFLSVLLVVIAGIMSHTYRPYIYNHQLNDFHFADSLTNLLAVPAYLCLYMALAKDLKYKIVWYVFATCLGFIIYEFIGFTFDYWDIVATIFSGLLTWSLFQLYINANHYST